MLVVVSIRLKPNTAAEFTQLIEKEALPLLRKQRGFQDEITLVDAGGKTAIGISLWDYTFHREIYRLSENPFLNASKPGDCRGASRLHYLTSESSGELKSDGSQLVQPVHPNEQPSLQLIAIGLVSFRSVRRPCEIPHLEYVPRSHREVSECSGGSLPHAVKRPTQTGMPVPRVDMMTTRTVSIHADARCKDRISSPARNFGVKGKMAGIQGPGKCCARNAAAFSRRSTVAIDH